MHLHVGSSLPPPVRQNMGLLATAHAAVARCISPGDLVVDATAGEGHDTLFLSQAVGNHGRVFAFDLQIEAIENTHRRLIAAGSRTQVTLFHADHARLPEFLPAHAQGQLRAFMANLGYLPSKGPGSLATHSETTLAALRTARSWLAPGGILSVLAYREHDGGEYENQTVAAFFRDELPGWQTTEAMNTSRPGRISPILRTAIKPQEPIPNSAAL